MKGRQRNGKKSAGDKEEPRCRGRAHSGLCGPHRRGQEQAHSRGQREGQGRIRRGPWGEERERAERLEKFKKAVFRVPIPAVATDAEEAQIRTAYRSAYNDVYYATIPHEHPAQAKGELERILEHAERTGDGLLARAAYHRAIDMGAQTVVDSYLSSRPADNKAWEAYTTAHAEVDQAGDIGYMLERGLVEQSLVAGGQQSHLSG